MLVKFDSEVGEFTMLGDHATALLKLMGHSGTIPSAILAEDIPAALERLESALTAESKPPADPNADDEEDAEPVTFHQRAFPLIEMLRNAAKAGCGIMWDRTAGGF